MQITPYYGVRDEIGTRLVANLSQADLVIVLPTQRRQNDFRFDM